MILRLPSCNLSGIFAISAGIIWGLLFLTAGPSRASVISLEIVQDVTVKEDSVLSRLKLTNKGDEPAHNVQISTEIGGEKKKGVFHDSLEVNQSLEEEVEFTVNMEKPGKYPVIVMIDYTDLNRYPFTAISIGEFDYKTRALGRVAGEIQAEPFSKTGRINLTVKNLEKEEHRFDLRLILPREFSTDQETHSIHIPPGEEGSVKYRVKNISALRDSRYQIYVLVSYEDETNHYMHPLGYIVEIIPFESFFSRYYTIFIWAASVLLVIVVAINLIKRRGQSRLP